MDEKYWEQAQALEQSRRDDALRDVRKSLEGKGRRNCLDCREVIAPARRKAAPHAMRCTQCQSTFEKYRSRQ